MSFTEDGLTVNITKGPNWQTARSSTPITDTGTECSFNWNDRMKTPDEYVNYFCLPPKLTAMFERVCESGNDQCLLISKNM